MSGYTQTRRTFLEDCLREAVFAAELTGDLVDLEEETLPSGDVRVTRVDLYHAVHESMVTVTIDTLEKGLERMSGGCIIGLSEDTREAILEASRTNWSLDIGIEEVAVIIETAAFDEVTYE